MAAYMKHVVMTITIPERAKATLDKQALARGVPTASWVNRVFDIGFAAICARDKQMPVTDADLDAIVGASLMLWDRERWDTEKIARGLGVTESTVIRILDGWKAYRRGQA